MSAKRFEPAAEFFGEAIGLMVAALSKKEDSDQRYSLMDARISRGICLAELKKYDEAVVEYQKGLEDLAILEQGSNTPPNAPAVRSFVEEQLEELQE